MRDFERASKASEPRNEIGDFMEEWRESGHGDWLLLDGHTNGQTDERTDGRTATAAGAYDNLRLHNVMLLLHCHLYKRWTAGRWRVGAKPSRTERLEPRDCVFVSYGYDWLLPAPHGMDAIRVAGLHLGAANCAEHPLMWPDRDASKRCRYTRRNTYITGVSTWIAEVLDKCYYYYQICLSFFLIHATLYRLNSIA